MTYMNVPGVPDHVRLLVQLMAGVAKKTTLRAKRTKPKGGLHSEARRRYAEDVRCLLESRLIDESFSPLSVAAVSVASIRPYRDAFAHKAAERITRISDILYCPRFYVGRDTCRVTTWINGVETVARIGSFTEFEHGIAFDGLGRTSLKLKGCSLDSDDNSVVVKDVLLHIGKKYSDLDYEPFDSAVKIVKSKDDLALFQLQLQKTIRYVSADKLLLLFLIEMKKLAETSLNTSIIIIQLILSNELQATLKLPQLQQLLNISNRIGLRIIF